MSELLVNLTKAIAPGAIALVSSKYYYCVVIYMSVETCLGLKIFGLV